MKNNLLLFTTAALLLFAASCSEQSTSIAFKTIEIKDYLQHPKGTQEYQGLDYTISFTYPSHYGDKTVLHTLQQSFITTVLGKKYASLSPQEAVNACINDWKEEYLTDTQEFPFEDDDYIPGYSYVALDTVTLVTDRLLQLKVESYMNQGGTHGIGATWATLYDLQTGQELGRNDVFDPRQADAIQRLLIREIDAIAVSEYEHDAVWTENTGFALFDDYMAFLYGDYQLGGSYAFGIRRVDVPYAQIFPYLRQGTPVWEYVQTKSAGVSEENTKTETCIVNTAEAENNEHEIVYVAGEETGENGKLVATLWIDTEPLRLGNGENHSFAYSVVVAKNNTIYVSGSEGIKATLWAIRDHEVTTITLEEPRRYYSELKGEHFDTGSDAYSLFVTPNGEVYVAGADHIDAVLWVVNGSNITKQILPRIKEFDFGKAYSIDVTPQGDICVAGYQCNYNKQWFATQWINGELEILSEVEQMAWDRSTKAQARGVSVK